MSDSLEEFRHTTRAWLEENCPQSMRGPAPVGSTYTFAVPEGRVATVVVVGYEKGGPTTPLEERPAVRYIERIERQARPDPEGEGDR